MSQGCVENHKKTTLVSREMLKKMRNFWRICRMYANNLVGKCLEPHFPRTCTTFAHVELFLFRCSTHPWDMYWVSTWGCHILFWAFSHQFICAHPADADILHIRTPGWFFFRVSAHPQDMYYTCTCCLHIIFWIFSHQFICAHSADALEIPHFSGTSILFFSLAIYMNFRVTSWC